MSAPGGIPPSGWAPGDYGRLVAWQRRIERELDAAGPANPLQFRRVSSRGNPGPRIVAGLRSVSQPGTVTVAWNNSEDPTVTHYEVQISDNASFTNPSTFQVIGVRFTYDEGDPDETYFARVRAVSANTGAVGDWSQPLNTQTGLAGSAFLEIGAATNPVGGTVLEFDPGTISTGGSETYNVGSIVTLGGTTVQSKFTFKFDFDSTYDFSTPVRISVNLLVDNVAIDDAQNDVFSSGIGRQTIPGLGKDVVLSQGTHGYQMQISIDAQGGGSTFEMTPVSLIFTLLELRR